MQFRDYNTQYGNFTITHACGFSMSLNNDMTAEKLALRHMETCKNVEPIDITKKQAN